MDHFGTRIPRNGFFVKISSLTALLKTADKSANLRSTVEPDTSPSALSTQSSAIAAVTLSSAIFSTPGINRKNDLNEFGTFFNPFRRARSSYSANHAATVGTVFPGVIAANAEIAAFSAAKFPFSAISIASAVCIASALNCLAVISPVPGPRRTGIFVVFLLCFPSTEKIA